LHRSITRIGFILASVFLLGGIVLSLVRTVWVAAAVMIAYAILAKRARWMARPAAVVSFMAISFFGASIAVNMLYSVRQLVDVSNNPIIARALTFGTLYDRIRSVDMFWKSLPQLWLRGYGYAADSWITSKFGGFTSLPVNFSEHNVVVELLWYFGLPGLILFSAVVFVALSHVWRYSPNDGLARATLGLLAAYVLGMYFTGLANGAVFLNFYFFFMLGNMLAATRVMRETVPREG